MRQRVARVEHHRPLEVEYRAGHQRRVERFEPYPPFGKGLVRLETARLPMGRCPLLIGSLDRKRVRELLDDAVLQLEDLLECSVGLRLGQRFAGRGIDHTRRDPKTVSGSLKAAHDRLIEMQVGTE